jgi:TPR repeat protein
MNETNGQADVEAARIYRLAADKGDAWAQSNLALFYSQGRGGLPKDEREAARLYKLAAEQGNAAAQNNLGFSCEQGRGGLPEDDREAARLYKLAAEQGDATAQSNLGRFYSQGRGDLPKDEREAARLYKLAAEQGDAAAQSNLALFYSRGRGGLPKDEREAARLYKLAANQGNAAAQENLSVFSGDGRSGLISGWFKSNSSLAVDIRNRAGDWGFFLWIFIPVGFFLGALAAVVAESAVVITFGLLGWWASWAPCPHGVPRGKTENRCERCVREQKEIEESRRREREIQERQRRIDAAAATLQESERLRLAKSLVPNIEELRRLSWQQFEDEVALMFERLGFAVKQTPYVNDGGRDLILSKDGKKYLGECKKYAEGSVSGRPDLQKFHSAMITDGAVSGLFVTAGGFTNEATDFAPLVQIELIDQDKLVRMMFVSKADSAEDDSYRSMCRQCEDIVSHHLRTPQSTRCRNGHDVAPGLPNFESLLPVSARPRKTRRVRRDNPYRSYRKIEQQAAKVAIAGNTYPVKDQLRNLGGHWDPDKRAWMVPAARAEEAKALVNGSSGSAAPHMPSSKDSGENDAKGGMRSGDRVVIRYLDDNKTATHTLSNARNDPANGVLSVASPLGEQLLGRVEGDETEFEVAGRLRRILIVALCRASSDCRAPMQQHSRPRAFEWVNMNFGRRIIGKYCSGQKR